MLSADIIILLKAKHDVACVTFEEKKTRTNVTKNTTFLCNI